MIHDGQTIEGPVTTGGHKQKYMVVHAGVIRQNGSQHVRARRQDEAADGTLMETEITLTFPKEDDYGEWRIIR